MKPVMHIKVLFQDTKRLPCAIPLPSGCLQHTGSHVHSIAADVFHYCDKRYVSFPFLLLKILIYFVDARAVDTYVRFLKVSSSKT